MKGKERPLWLLALFVCACVKATPAAQESSEAAPRDEVEVEVEAAKAKAQPPEPVSRARSVPEVVEARLEFREWEECVLQLTGSMTPLAADDGSEVVLLARRNTSYSDGTYVALQGLWRLKPGESATFGPESPLQIIDWYGLDSTDCVAAQRQAGRAVDEANAYLASKTWRKMTPIDPLAFEVVAPPVFEGTSCVSARELSLCTKKSWKNCALFCDEAWRDGFDTAMYADLQNCVVVVVQRQGSSSATVEVTAAAVFDIREIVHVMPADFRSGACADQM